MLEFKIIYGDEGYWKAKAVRQKVFMEEQGFSYDNDEKDKESYHIIAYDGDKAIAAARMFEKEAGVFTIGRVAVLKDYRRQYIGDTLMKVLEDRAVGLKGHLIYVGAQESALPFYEKEGYIKTGEKYEVEGVVHYSVTKDLTKPIIHCKGCNK